MKRLFLIVTIIALGFTACKEQKKSPEQTPETVTTTISGRFVGSGIDNISLERISDDFQSTEHIADHELSANGDFSFELEIEEGTSPRYYQIMTGENFPITLIVAPGDEITLESAGDIFANYRISGSEESALVREFTTSYFGDYVKFIEFVGNGDSNSAIKIAKEAIHKQIEFIITNTDKLASVFATRLRLFESFLPQFESQGVNYIHLQSISEALTKSYPSSPYIYVLNNDIEHIKMIIEAPTSLYPEITLSDINRNVHKLSELRGKVTLLCFWSSEDSMSNIFVAEFKDIYNRYHDKGLEAYFVSADSNRAAWIDMVQQQQHPWTSVYGGDSQSVFTSYNIQVVPYAYIIDRDDNMHYAPLVPKELEKLIKELL